MARKADKSMHHKKAMHHLGQMEKHSKMMKHHMEKAKHEKEEGKLIGKLSKMHKGKK